MARQNMFREAELLLAEARMEGPTEGALLEEIRADPSKILSLAGMCPDGWQQRLLHSSALRILILASRQAGKSMTAAALGLREALLYPQSLVLLLSPSQRQSGELFRDKVMKLFNALDRPVPTVQETQLSMQLENGSRIVSLPGDESTIRGYSGVSLAVIDEAARVDDNFYRACRPFLAVSRGRLVCLSTPFGKRGWFYDEFTGNNPWERVEIPATECPRISPEFLEEERAALGERWYRQEYMCSWEETVDAVFSHADIMAALENDLPPLLIA
jgi:hypothetical protein